MAINIEEISELLRLSQESAKIYIELLTHGNLSKAQIAKFSDIPPLSLDSGLKELEHQGLILSLQNANGKKVFQTTSLWQMEERQEREKEALHNLKKFIWPQINQPQKLGLMKYEGWEGIRKVYIEVLEEAINTKEPILAFENIPPKETSPIGKLFLENYLHKRLENKILAKVIAPDTAACRAYKRENDNGFTKTKIFPKLRLTGTINIVGNLVMSYSSTPPRGTLRRDQVEAFNLKQIFDGLWRI